MGAWITALALASCGGGGGSGNDGGFTAPGLRVSVVPAQTQTTPFSLVDVPVRVTTANGASVTDGTRVTMQVSSSSVGSVSSLQAVTGSAIYGERVTALRLELLPGNVVRATIEKLVTVDELTRFVTEIKNYELMEKN